MTLETDSELDPAIIDALRLAARAPVPRGRRERVASRLAAGAGVVALSTRVAGASQLAATSAAAAGASGIAPVASTAAALTVGGLAKMLAVGLTLGSVAGLGMHLGFRALDSAQRSAFSAPSGAVRTAPPPSSPPLPKTSIALTAPPEHDAPLASGEETHALRSAPAAAPMAQVNPSPELPASGAEHVAPPGLAEQQALLDRARAFLRRGDGIGALAAIHTHLERFPSTALEEEREAVTIKALVLTGNRGQAAQELKSFEARFAKSLFLPALHAAVEPHRGARGVTDAAASTQTDVGK